MFVLAVIRCARRLFVGRDDCATNALLQQAPARNDGLARLWSPNAGNEGIHLAEEPHHLNRLTSASALRSRPGHGGWELDFGEMRELSPAMHGDVHRVDKGLRRRRERKTTPPIPRHGRRRLR